MPKNNTLLQKPNQKPTSQVSPHNDDKYNQQKLLFKPKNQLDDKVVIVFSANNTQPDQYDEIQFTDTTNGAVEWYWDFGDGFTSTEQNPTHVYGGGAGSTYTVRLIVKDNQDRVGIAVKEDLIEVQNDSYIADKINTPEILISVCNRVRSNQTIAFEAVEHDTGSYNVMNVGYNSNDEVDFASLENWVNNNGYTEAYVKNIRGENDNIIAEETTTSNRLVINFKDPGLDSPGYGNNVSNKYELTNQVVFSNYRQLFAGYVVGQDPDNILSNPVLQIVVNNSGVAGFTLIDRGVRTSDVLGNQKGGAIASARENQYGFYYHNRDEAESYFNSNGSVGFKDLEDSNIGDDITYLVRNHRGSRPVKELVFSRAAEDIKKLEAYYKNKYPSNIYV